MKPLLLCSLGAALLFTGCAGVRVVNTQTAAVVTERPRAIFIEPFSVDSAEYVGDHEGGLGERPIRQSLAPAEFSNILQQELEKLAPARVLRSDEAASEGWLVDGSIEVVDGGSRWKRGVGMVPGLNPVGQSRIAIHVRVRDMSGRYVGSEDKDDSTLRRRGRVIYEFDVAGGSRLSGARGTVTASGLGHSAPFDYRNATERIRAALEPDRMRYGVRNSPTVR